MISAGGLEGHVSRDCTMEVKAKSCYKCGQEGHIVCFLRMLVNLFTHWIQSRDCPDAGAGGGGGSYGGGFSSQECYRCGKPGHIARACPEAAGGNSSYGGGGGGGGNYSAFGGGGSKTWFVSIMSILHCTNSPYTAIPAVV
ncbi:uncharacterized protein F5147DRAFT_224672 [Suillus discolor]|uniref:CCHC-type domain-containing protein n=1 Tax=Suillus discolor TaxID=1912936 RepID=A0A9P7JT67_9AGAM|nr:uncharacterized protein F5147DRAFT_224672 [Suillus discolor]KAG2106793.1 hypothetical protein F5147DRAFT_224672 [Suillus discolor]